MNHEGGDTLVMIIIMILSGIMSTMNMWTDKLDDIRLSLNDVYMISLMSGWMLFFTGIYYKSLNTLVFGILIAGSAMFLIRSQAAVSGNQYRLGMIPHHSMAVHMSRKYLEKKTDDRILRRFAERVIKNQEEEIAFLKGINNDM